MAVVIVASSLALVPVAAVAAEPAVVVTVSDHPVDPDGQALPHTEPHLAIDPADPHPRRAGYPRPGRTDPGDADPHGLAPHASHRRRPAAHAVVRIGREER